MEQMGKSDPKDICVRRLAASCLNVVVQLLCAVMFCLGALWLVAVGLEFFNSFGISTIPPGLAYAEYRHADGRVY